MKRLVIAIVLVFLMTGGVAQGERSLTMKRGRTAIERDSARMVARGEAQAMTVGKCDRYSRLVVECWTYAVYVPECLGGARGGCSWIEWLMEAHKKHGHVSVTL